MSNEIPITIGFDNNRSAGNAQINDYAKKIFEDMKVNGVDYVLAPGFIIKRQDEDGTIHECELIELSLIPAARAVKK